MNPPPLSCYSLDARNKYRILIRGTLDADWSNRLGGMTLSVAQLADGSSATLLLGEVADQSALVGILNALHDLGMPLVSVECITGES